MLAELAPDKLKQRKGCIEDVKICQAYMYLAPLLGLVEEDWNLPVVCPNVSQRIDSVFKLNLKRVDGRQK